MKADLEKYNATVITSIHMDADDFDQLVKDSYGANPVFVVLQKANNDSSYTFDYSDYPEKDSLASLYLFSKKTLYDFVGEDKAEVQALVRQGVYSDYGVGQIFATLIDDGILPPAHYTINVCW